VAKAPDGKEVEELVQKEILLALKRKVPYAQAFTETNYNPVYQPRPRYEQPRPFTPRDNSQSFGRNNFRPNNFERPRFEQGRNDRNFERRPFNNFRPRFQENRFPIGQQVNIIKKEEPIPEEILKLKKDFDKLKGKSKAKLLDEKNKKIKEVEVKDMLEAIQKSKKKIQTILFDGIITNRLVEVADAKGIKVVVGVKKGNIAPQKVKTYTL
jgi:DNA primase